jgi:hypothetical protein
MVGLLVTSKGSGMSTYLLREVMKTAKKKEKKRDPHPTIIATQERSH